MSITITPQALAWFKKDWGFKSGDFIRFFVRYGGGTSLHKSYSMGISKTEPNEIALSSTVEGMTFFFEKDDMWFIEDKSMTVDFNEALEEITFSFQ
ncbi:HesB/YadR/YfhF family protein [Brevibacillus laterosporus]|uniref:Core domain-containing protein n=2 Tax=Brevibacillus TaxID=55080 RepID=A0A0F7EEL6_BRELA|nr:MULTISPECIES: HesB/YadR/YfhF family protein [Brevibacillus]AKF92953.1 hypothetical protein EX87_04170 [Brevibacillus laterosporus]MCR8986827.1 HesB/YadR/YfhF family protein [Brevibacillus laterosporus]MCZ0832563.1 HesB/YadR/YfhF family protein [Brevibacillus halotolerans]GIO01957.1 hypothetical protein J5TS2_26250 [Brevibacillus halotolerans]